MLCQNATDKYRSTCHGRFNLDSWSCRTTLMQLCRVEVLVGTHDSTSTGAPAGANNSLVMANSSARHAASEHKQVKIIDNVDRCV